jgi:hypothetical protein
MVKSLDESTPTPTASRVSCTYTWCRPRLRGCLLSRGPAHQGHVLGVHVRLVRGVSARGGSGGASRGLLCRQQGHAADGICPLQTDLYVPTLCIHELTHPTRLCSPLLRMCQVLGHIGLDPLETPEEWEGVLRAPVEKPKRTAGGGAPHRPHSSLPLTSACAAARVSTDSTRQAWRDERFQRGH